MAFHLVHGEADTWNEILRYLPCELSFDGGDTGAAVAASWLILLLGGLWRRSAAWIDRSGRILGVFWIANGLAFGFGDPLIAALLSGR